MEYALVQDATGKTAGEIHEMPEADRYTTALLRARWYREKNQEAKNAANQNRL